MSDAPFELKGFEPISRLGGGGFGEVWLARQVNIDRQVAIKIGHAPIDDKTVQLRFERECIALGRLSGHPNIIDVFTAGQLDDDRPYLVLEFVNGGTLWQRLQRSPLSESELCRVGIQLSDALTVAHGAGVLHRDLKPENVLLRQNGDAVLGDFGIARLHDGANTTSHAITASVAYAAPEILSGKSASVASDLYGIGICLLASVLRSVPFVHKTDESIHPIINRVLTDKPPELRQHGVSEQLSSAIGMLLEKDPDKRPRSATDTKALLERAATSASSSAPSGAGPTIIAPSPPPHATESGQRSGPAIAPSPGPSTGSHAAPAASPGPGARPAPHHAPPPPAALPQQRPAPPHNTPAPTGFPAPPRPQSGAPTRRCRLAGRVASPAGLPAGEPSPAPANRQASAHRPRPAALSRYSPWRTRPGRSHRSNLSSPSSSRRPVARPRSRPRGRAPTTTTASGCSRSPSAPPWWSGGSCSSCCLACRVVARTPRRTSRPSPRHHPTRAATVTPMTVTPATVTVTVTVTPATLTPATVMHRRPRRQPRRPRRPPHRHPPRRPSPSRCRSPSPTRPWGPTRRPRWTPKGRRHRSSATTPRSRSASASGRRRPTPTRPARRSSTSRSPGSTPRRRRRRISGRTW